MTFRYHKLRARIIEKYGTLSKFAKVAHTSQSRVSELLNNKANFSQEEIVQWSILLDIEMEQIGEFFFLLNS